MSSPIDRSRAERLARAIREKQHRHEREKQADLGGRGRQGGLIRFIRYFWHVLEPATPFVDGWAMQAVCMHLEAVTRGEIKRILINVPPGFAKSLIVNCFWPAWEWGPAAKPHLRYVTFAYAAHLTERDNARFRDVVQSHEYRELWGHGFKLVEDGKVKPSNDSKGWKFSSSIRGVGTGERGNRILCFPADQVVATERGDIAIGELVANRMQVRAWSLNRRTHELELRPIIGWHSNSGRQLVRVTTAGGAAVVCTHDHRIYTERGLVEASRLVVGDRLFAASSGMSIASATVAAPKVKIEVGPNPPGADACDCPGANAELGGQSGCRVVVSGGDLSDEIFSKIRGSVLERAVPLAVGDILGSGPVLDIGESGVAPVSVLVPDFLSFRSGTKERLGDQYVAHLVNGSAANPKGDTRIATRKCPRHQLAGNGENVGALGVACPVSVGGESSGPCRRAWEAADAPETGDLVRTFRADHGAPLLVAVCDVDFIQEIPLQTFCITVEENNNLVCGDSKANIICSNCDDIHNIKEGESETIRGETVRWVREGMSNRLNDMQEDVIIGIGQRVHEEDASAAMLEDGDYVHLMIPMEFDPGRRCTTSIGWEDPRTEHGELAWPERFPAPVVAKLKRTLGPYAYAAQYLQSPEPRGGGILKRDWWGAYELAVGAPFRHNFDYILASLDGAYTAREENDPSALVVFGVYVDNGHPKIVLLHAWQKWLEIHGQTVKRMPNEDNRAYVRRASPNWGLVEWVAHDCTRLRVHKLLIENKASGHSVSQEIARLYQQREWQVQLVDPRGMDKRSRALAIQHLFADGMIEAPASLQGDVLMYRDWAQMVIDEAAKFRGLPGDSDNLVDALTQALKHLRDLGLAIRREERQFVEEEEARHRPRSQPLYPA